MESAQNHLTQIGFFQKLKEGTISKNEFAKLTIPVIFIQIIGWVLARVFYPQGIGYRIDFNVISNQGNYVQNPIGAIFFAISTTIVSSFLILYFYFSFKRLMPAVALISKLYLFAGIIGAIGLGFVGIFPEQGTSWVQFMHNLGSSLGFGGLCTAIGLSFLIQFIRIVKKYPWPTFIQFICVLFLPLHFLLLVPFTMNWSVTQWTMFNLVFVWIIGFFIILPDNPENVKM